MTPLRDTIMRMVQLKHIEKAQKMTSNTVWYECHPLYMSDTRVWWQVRQTILESMR